MPRKLTDREFAERVRQKGKGKWVLVDTKWKGKWEPKRNDSGLLVPIVYRLICKEHGPFTKSGSLLLARDEGGCQKCGHKAKAEFTSQRNRDWAKQGRFKGRKGTTTLSIEEVRKRIREKSNGLWVLLDREWKGGVDSDGNPIFYSLRCRLHGDFKKRGSNLVASTGGGCLKCFAERRGIGQDTSGKSPSRPRELSNQIVDERLREKGDQVVRLEDYKGALTKILFLCKKHGQKLKARPSDVFKSNGLLCCRQENMRLQGRLAKKRSAQSFDSRLRERNPNLERIGEYIDAKTPILFLCKSHSTEDKPQIHECSPSRALVGSGLRCCKVEHGRSLGKIYGTRIKYDAVWRVLVEQSEDHRAAFLYLYSTTVSGYHKFGVSNRVKQRAQHGKYGKPLITPIRFEDRADAVFIEDAYKNRFGVEPPSSLATWEGNSELTSDSAELFQKRISSLIEVYDRLREKYPKVGRWKFAESHCQSFHVKVARRILKLPKGCYPE